MALEDMFKSGLGKGLAIGIGAAVLVPILFPSVVRAARPMARAALKSGMIMYEKGMEMAAEFGEVVEDLMAEARAEMDEAPAVAAEAAATQETGPESAEEVAEQVHES